MRVTEDMIHPDLRLPGKVMRKVFGSRRSVEDLMKSEPLIMKLFRRLPAIGMRRSDRMIVRPDGSSLRLVILKPRESVTRPPVMLWLHGGGYSMGSVEAEFQQMRALMDVGKCIIVSPDYRLSTVAPYPAALEDCYSALLWLQANAEDLGGNPDRIIVAGGSAGGGLTAATTLYARDKGEVRVAFQMPIYPMIDDRGTTPSMVDNDAPVYDAVTNESNWRIYLGELYGRDVPSYAAPARARDFRDLPPTITYVGGIEPFRDETIAYVEGLRGAGVPVKFREFPGAWHGFDGIAPWTGIAKDAKRWLLASFREFLELY